MSTEARDQFVEVGAHLSRYVQRIVDVSESASVLIERIIVVSDANILA